MTEKLYTEAELHAALAAMVRKAAEHYPVMINLPDPPWIKERMACLCGNLVADGVTPWAILWPKHIEEVLSTPDMQSALAEIEQEHQAELAAMVRNVVAYLDEKDRLLIEDFEAAKQFSVRDNILAMLTTPMQSALAEHDARVRAEVADERTDKWETLSANLRKAESALAEAQKELADCKDALLVASQRLYTDDAKKQITALQGALRWLKDPRVWWIQYGNFGQCRCCHAEAKHPELVEHKLGCDIAEAATALLEGGDAQ